MELVTIDTRRVPGPGLYRMPAEVYHADPAPGPSLSSSLIPLMLENSPRHVWAAHPRLGKIEDEDEDESVAARVSIGSVAHEILLGQGGGYEVIDAKDFRTKAAQEAKAVAVANGKTPVLASQFARAENIAHAIRSTIGEIPAMRGAFDPEQSYSEIVGVFRCPNTGVWGRFMVDNWGPSPDQIWDVKTTTSSLTNRFIENMIEDGGLGARAAWYLHGVETLRPELVGRVQYHFVFAEQDAPHEVRIEPLTEDQKWRGLRKALHAATLFDHNLKTCGTSPWRGFPRRIGIGVTSKPWRQKDWEQREETDPLFEEVGGKLLMALSPMAPAPMLDQWEGR